MLFIGLLFMELSRLYLFDKNINLVSSPDLLLDILPSMSLDNILVWGLQLLLVFIAVVHYVYPEYIPFSCKTVGLLFFIRSFFVVLTPLGIRPDQVVMSPEGIFASLAYSSNDFFFSGHVSLPFMLGLIFWQKPWVRNGFFGVAMVFAAGVLLAHTHYSIDVFVVPLVAPTILTLSRYLFGKEEYAYIVHEHEQERA